jgi:glycosyltransferase involved in cell wall biosynthesis
MLFVSHEATRTGAPRVLLTFLQWAARATDLRFEVLLRRGGPLEPEFRALAPTTVLDERPPDSWPARFERELGRGPLQDPVLRAMKAARRRQLRHLRDFEVIYLNSAASAPALDLLSPARRLVISHIHELEIQLEHALHEPGALETLYGRTDRWVAAGDGVRAALVARGADPTEVATHREFIERSPRPDPAGRDALRQALGIPRDAVVVGMMGTIEPRKGPDLFVALAQQLRSRHGDGVRFVWIGASRDSPWHWPVEEDIRRAGLGGVLHLTGELEDPSAHLGLFDVFALTSREDPFPVACLEAAACGIPIVSFESGGMVEFLAHGGGTVVPALHVCAMASAVSRLIDDPELRAQTGARGAAEVVRSHDVEQRAPA